MPAELPTRPANLPPIDLGRTTCYRDGMLAIFYGPDGRQVVHLWNMDHLVPEPKYRWDPRSVVVITGQVRGCTMELLPDGTAVDFQGGAPVATGEDFSMLLDLALAAGLVVETAPLLGGEKGAGR